MSDQRQRTIRRQFGSKGIERTGKLSGTSDAEERRTTALPDLEIATSKDFEKGLLKEYVNLVLDDWTRSYIRSLAAQGRLNLTALRSGVLRFLVWSTIAASITIPLALFVSPFWWLMLPTPILVTRFGFRPLHRGGWFDADAVDIVDAKIRGCAPFLTTGRGRDFWYIYDRPPGLTTEGVFSDSFPFDLRYPGEACNGLKCLVLIRKDRPEASFLYVPKYFRKHCLDARLIATLQSRIPANRTLYSNRREGA